MQTPSPIKNPQEVPKIVENIPKSDNKKEKALKRVKTIRTSQINPVLRIEPGEYQIHLFIEETRGLQNPELASESIDPVIKVSVFEESKNIGPKLKVGSGQIYWGEHMFFTKKIEDQRYFFSHKVHIEVLNYHKIGKNSKVGEISLDLISIYIEPKHCLLHKWAGLSNFEKNYEEVKGFLKFSMTILGEKDDPIVLEKERIMEKTKNKDKKKNKKLESHIGKGGMKGANILLAPQLKTKGQQMKIKLIRGDQLMKLDFFGSIDSYVICEFGSGRFVTEPISNTRTPLYGLAVYLPYSEPTINEFLTLTIMDYDRGKKDDILGTILLNKTDIINEKYKEIGWIDIYGAHPDSSNEFSDLMNADSNIGNYWKGRLLMSIESYSLDNPKLCCQKIEDKDLQGWKENVYSEFVILGEIYYGFSLPKENCNYSIQIRWADKELNFPEKKSMKSLCEWYSQKTMTVKLPYLSSAELPDLIIYLLLDNKRISYHRTPITSFIDYNLNTKQPQLFYFKPEKSEFKDLRHDLAGIIKMRIGIVFEEILVNEVLNAWNKDFKKPEIKPGILITNINHCKGLSPSDNEGTSDPFVVVSYHGNEISSEVVEQTLNPVWNQRVFLKIPIFINDGKTCYDDATILLKIFDKDSIKVLDTEVYSSDEFLGAALIQVNQAREAGYLTLNSDAIPDPSFIDLEYNKLKVGKLLVSFNLLEYEDKIPKEIVTFSPPSEKFSIKIRILGLRNLKSPGILNIQKPFLKFDFNGLNKNLKDKKNIIVTSPEGGSDPNISAIINFDVDLPKNYNLCPSLTCIVFDTVWEGVFQPVLGCFSIDIGSLMSSRNNELDYKKASKLHKIQSNFILNVPAPIPIQGNEDEPFLELDIDEGRKHQISMRKLSDDEKTQDDNGIIVVGKYVKKFKKYPPVLTEKGELNQEFIIIKPKYVKDAKKQFMSELEIPDPECYIGLGHDKREDKLKNQTKKHYRSYINCELEKSKFVNENLFNQFPILKGKRFVEEDFFENLGLEQKLEEVGLFKGWIDVYKYNDVGSEPEETDLLNPRNEDRLDEIDSLILKNEDFLVRVYVIDALNLESMDDDSLSDPYIQLILGETKIHNREEYQKDQTNVAIFRLFELKCSLPGPSQLHVQVWDHDIIKKDDLIGETIIDLENRYFSKKWRVLEQKPIETRILRQPISSMPRGKIRLWVELIPLNAIDKKIKWYIEPKPHLEFEIRVVVWECSNVPARDKEGTSDIYIIGKIGEQQFQTDTHLRSADGYGSFNWRMVWRVMLPIKDPTITFQIWDQDFMTEDDFIAEATIDFGRQAELAYENDAIAKIYGKKFMDVSKSLERFVEKLINPKGHAREKTNEIFEISLKNIDKLGVTIKERANSHKEKKCKINLSFEILPLEYALKNPVGQGRNDPNVNPWLSPPLKRYNFGLDPSEIIKTIITPEIKAKLIIGGIIFLCLCICILFIVVFLAGIASNAA